MQRRNCQPGHGEQPYGRLRRPADLTRDPDLVSARISRVRVRAYDLDRDPDRDLALRCVLDDASALARSLDRTLNSARTVSSEKRRVETARLAGRLMTAATPILLVMDQARYGEEFRSELAEIARAGGGRWSRMVRRPVADIRLVPSR